MPATENTSVLPADYTQWSEKSQRTLSADFIKEYTSYRYDCWRCRASSIFTAADQKYTYEVKKAPIDQRRILCGDCWKNSQRIGAALEVCRQQWAQSKASLKSSKLFLSGWLALLAEREEYIPYRPNTATKNMLRKLLGDA
jgi:Probable zinc-ribbon domain